MSSDRQKAFGFTFCAIPDINYALEGYRISNPKRLPKSSLPGISMHVYGQAVDVSEGINLDNKWKEIGYTEINKFASTFHLRRPYNRDYLT